MTTDRVLLISGSLRAGSTNSAAIRAADDVDTIRTEIYDDLGSLPHFDPDIEAGRLPEVVARLRQAISDSTAVLICTPEYAGSLPGSFKNLLDWTVGDNDIVGKPVAWINVSASATKAAGAHVTLRTVLEYTGANIVDAACQHIPVSRADLDATGALTTPLAREQIQAAVQTLVSFGAVQP